MSTDLAPPGHVLGVPSKWGLRAPGLRPLLGFCSLLVIDSVCLLFPAVYRVSFTLTVTWPQLRFNLDFLLKPCLFFSILGAYKRNNKILWQQPLLGCQPIARTSSWRPAWCWSTVPFSIHKSLTWTAYEGYCFLSVDASCVVSRQQPKKQPIILVIIISTS